MRNEDVLGRGNATYETQEDQEAEGRDAFLRVELHREIKEALREYRECSCSMLPSGSCSSRLTD